MPAAVISIGTKKRGFWSLLEVATSGNPPVPYGILLLDEAFSALDPGTRAGMQRLMKDLWRETGTTVLFVTHNPREAVILATRVIALGRTGTEDNGANIVLDLSVPDTNEESKIASLIQRIEQTTFPGGGAESDEVTGAPEA